MPGRAFDTTVMPTQSLRELSYQLANEIITLEESYRKCFKQWCDLGIINATQAEQDRAGYACKNLRRNRSRVYNKRTQVIEEIMNRDKEEQMAFEAEMRRR